MSRKKRRLANLQNAESQTYTGTQELIDSEEGLIGYSTEIVRKFFSKMDLENRIVSNGRTLLEFGAGTGFLADIFRSTFQIKPDWDHFQLPWISLMSTFVPIWI